MSISTKISLGIFSYKKQLVRNQSNTLRITLKALKTIVSPFELGFKKN